MSLILKQETASSIPAPPSGKTTLFVDPTGSLATRYSNGGLSTISLTGGSNTQVQFNNDGSLDGDANLTYIATTGTLTSLNLTVTNTLEAGNIYANAGTISGNTIVADANVSAAGVKTDNLYYANGTPWDLGGNPGGSNTYIQYNNNGEFGASANLIFNSDTNTLTITGNAIASNIYANSGTVGASAIQATTSVTAPQLVSNVSTGTAPLTVSSTTKVTNLNADLLDGYNTSTSATADTVAVRDTNGNLTANYFIGNGSQLTGIDATSIQNGNSNVKVSANGNVTISVTGNANIVTVTDTGVNVAGYVTSTGNITAPYFIGNVQGNISGNLTAPGANTNIIFNDSGTANATAGFTFDKATNAVTILGNITSANATLGNLATANYVSGVLTTASQPNITSVGTLTSLAVTGNITAGNVTDANLMSANYFTGTLTTASQPNITSVGTLTSLGVTGNVDAGNVYANSGTVGASLLTGTLTTSSQPNITSVGTLSSLAVTGNITAGNVTNANLMSANYLTGTLTTASQPNITSVGTLTSLTVTGTITGGNLSTGGTLGVTGNANVGNIGAAAGVFTGNVSANNITTTNKITAGNGLLISTGALTVSNGNLDVTGNINVTGNLNYSNVTDLVVGDPLIYIGANNTGDLYDLGIVASYNDGTYQHTGIVRNHTNDTWTFFDGVVAEPTTVIDWANATYPTVKMGNLVTTGTANITGNANVGNLGAAQVLATANIIAPQLVSNVATGTAPFVVTSTTQVANLSVATAGSATTAGTVTTAAQPNITSVGTLSSLTVSGNVAAGNLNATSSVVASTLVSNVATGTAPFTVTSTTQVANLNVATAGSATSATNANALLQNTSTTTTVYPTFTTSSANGYSSAVINTSISANLSNAAITATTFVGSLSGTASSATNAAALLQNTSTSTTVYPTFTTSSANGNSSAVFNTSISANLGNASITATTFVGALSGAATTAGTVTTAAQPNITSVGTLTSLGVNGTITGVNITANTGVFTGNGSGISSIAAGNLTTGTVATARLGSGTANSTTYLRGDSTWATVTSGITITDDTTTNATYYPALTTATSGSISTANVSSTKLYFNPSTGQLSSTDFNSLSDASFKTNVEPIINGMLVVANIEPVSFNWIDTGRKAYGVIAQEIEKVIPEIVTTGPDGKKTVSYDQIIPFLISAIKDLNEQIQELKKR